MNPSLSTHPSLRKKIAAGNWKMNTTRDTAIELAQSIVDGYQSAGERLPEVILAVPSPFLDAVSKVIAGHEHIHLAAQDLHPEEKGAYTGEISGPMLKSVGCSHVLVGHSERRNYAKETNALLARKLEAALNHGLIPVYCFGETLEERESGATFDVISRQLEEAAFSLSITQFSQLILAYEPVWAIGTGKTASPAQAEEVHAFVRGLINRAYSPTMAFQTSILYGGSVTAANAEFLFACPNIDGGLVGGASLKAGEFLEIVGAFL